MQGRPYLYFFWTMNVAALFAVVYVFYDISKIMNSIRNDEPAIPYDSGTYYLLILTVFWLFTYLEYKGLREGLAAVRKSMNKAVTIWFAITVILGFVIPLKLEDRFETSGYQAAPNPDEISRISIGRSIIYTKRANKDRP